MLLILDQKRLIKKIEVVICRVQDLKSLLHLKDVQMQNLKEELRLKDLQIANLENQLLQKEKLN